MTRGKRDARRARVPFDTGYAARRRQLEHGLEVAEAVAAATREKQLYAKGQELGGALASVLG